MPSLWVVTGLACDQLMLALGNRLCTWTRSLPALLGVNAPGTWLLSLNSEWVLESCFSEGQLSPGFCPSHTGSQPYPGPHCNRRAFSQEWVILTILEFLEQGLPVPPRKLYTMLPCPGIQGLNLKAVSQVWLHTLRVWDPKRCAFQATWHPLSMEAPVRSSCLFCSDIYRQFLSGNMSANWKRQWDLLLF